LLSESNVQLVYVAPAVGIVNDNVRSSDPEFFQRVVDSFEYFIRIYRLDVTHLSGSREQRVQQVIKAANLQNE
jgi:hypothetical protein